MYIKGEIHTHIHTNTLTYIKSENSVTRNCLTYGMDCLHKRKTTRLEIHCLLCEWLGRDLYKIYMILFAVSFFSDIQAALLSRTSEYTRIG